MQHFILSLSAAAFALPLAAMAEQGSFDSAGVQIHYTDEGEGPAVVMLHSFGGSSAMWPAVGLAPLDGFRTLTFDARGHGESGKPVTSEAYGDEMVADILRLMEARGIAQAHFVGYSMGAETALKFAADHPDRVLSLVVAGSGWSQAPEAEVYGYVSQALSGVGSFADFMAAMAPETEMSDEEQAAGLALLAMHGIDPMQAAAPLSAVAGALPEIIGLSAEDLAAIEVPVLGIAGQMDTERDAVAALADGLPHFDFVEIPGADHLVAPTDPSFTTAVVGFLNP